MIDLISLSDRFNLIGETGLGGMSAALGGHDFGRVARWTLPLQFWLKDLPGAKRRSCPTKAADMPP
jgi:hypothetical protein